jgi:hypothetical protein
VRATSLWQRPSTTTAVMTRGAFDTPRMVTEQRRDLCRCRETAYAYGVETTLDAAGEAYLAGAARSGTLRLVAHHPVRQDADAYRDKIRAIHRDHDVPRWMPLVLVEVAVVDASDFETALHVRGLERFGHRILTVRSSAVANTIAELLLVIRDRTGLVPHVYFTWTEGNPLRNLLRFLFVGTGEVAPVTREVLREAEPDSERRPHVHVA